MGMLHKQMGLLVGFWERCKLAQATSRRQALELASGGR
jgi:hypothetical protein